MYSKMIILECNDVLLRIFYEYLIKKQFIASVVKKVIKFVKFKLQII